MPYNPSSQESPPLKSHVVSYQFVNGTWRVVVNAGRCIQSIFVGLYKFKHFIFFAVDVSIYKIGYIWIFA